MPGSSGKSDRPHPLRRRIVIEKADRFHRLSADPMGELLRIRARAERRGLSIIDFTRSVSDLPPPPPGKEEGDQAHREAEIRRRIAERFRRERGVSVDPKEEVLPLLHLPEGFQILALCFVNPGEVVLLPDPGDPIFRNVSVEVGGWPIPYPLLESRRFLPDFDRIEPEAGMRAKLLFTSSPGLPTSTAGEAPFYERMIDFARRRNVIVAVDATLAGATLRGKVPGGLLDHPGGKEVGVEFHSLAPFHDFGGWRPGYAVGNREILFAMAGFRSLLGTPFRGAAVQDFLHALMIPEEAREKAVSIFRGRIDAASEGLAGLGWDVEPPGAGFSLWVRVPHRYHSMNFSSLLVRKAGIAVVPGLTFGEFGHDHVLISLTQDEATLGIALDRLRRLGPGRRGLARWIRQRRQGKE